MDRPKRILLVCTGNTCRSPMAAALLKAATPGLEVRSAGILAREGDPVSPEAVETLRRRGLDLSGHRASPVRDELVEWADLILAMTRGHRDALVGRYPEAAGKVELLLAGEELDVSDPLGKSQAVYDRCADDLERALAARLDGR